jgi:hypothetical protein
LLTPRYHAEWVFQPSAPRAGEAADVGLFLDHGEVLSLSPLTPPVTNGNKIEIRTAIGSIHLEREEWIAWKKPLGKAVTVFDESRILFEYQTEN